MKSPALQLKMQMLHKPQIAEILQRTTDYGKGTPGQFLSGMRQKAAAGLHEHPGTVTQFEISFRGKLPEAFPDCLVVALEPLRQFSHRRQPVPDGEGPGKQLLADRISYSEIEIFLLGMQWFHDLSAPSFLFLI